MASQTPSADEVIQALQSLLQSRLDMPGPDGLIRTLIIFAGFLISSDESACADSELADSCSRKEGKRPV